MITNFPFWCDENLKNQYYCLGKLSLKLTCPEQSCCSPTLQEQLSQTPTIMFFTHWTTPYGWVAPLKPLATGQYFFVPCIKCTVYLNFNND